jgi:hypothetical protein
MAKGKEKKKSKWLYTFDVNKEVDEKVESKSTNDAGEEVTVSQVKTVDKPVNLSLRKPTRKMYDDGELFYGVQLSEGIKAGLLTRTLLAKRYQNDGGVLSEPEKERYSVLYLNLFNKENDLQRIQVNLDNLSDNIKKDKITDTLMEMAELRRELQEFENSQSSLFDNTAETRAKNKTIMWWVLHLSHIMNEAKDWKPLFGEGSYDTRLARYDEIEEEDSEWKTEAVRKLAYFVSFWYSGQATTEEEFEKVATLLRSDVDIERIAMEQVSEEEESKKAEKNEAEESQKAEEAKSDEEAVKKAEKEAKAAEKEAAKKATEEEAAKKATEEEAAKKAAEEEAAKKAAAKSEKEVAEEAIAKKKTEQAAKKKAAEKNEDGE